MRIPKPTGSALALILLAACNGDEPAKTPTGNAGGLDHELALALFSNENPAPPPEIPPTPELVALGNALYHHEGLSAEGNLSCASCHDLGNWGVDNRPTSPGSKGELGDRNTPTTYNAFRQFAQFWDGRAVTVEDQATGPMFNPVEHGVADEAELAALIRADPGLVAGFAEAFPGEDEPVSAANFAHAVGAFERTLVTRSRWDDYLDGNPDALTAAEQAGLAKFIEVGCTTCHGNRTLGGHMFQKFGLVQPYDGGDTGRMKVSGKPADKFIFKVPMLLNVEQTGPYFHDGSAATLEGAVRHMAEVQLGRNLAEQDVASIVTFLKALTGDPRQAPAAPPARR